MLLKISIAVGMPNRKALKELVFMEKPKQKQNLPLKNLPLIPEAGKSESTVLTVEFAIVTLSRQQEIHFRHGIKGIKYEKNNFYRKILLPVMQKGN